MHRVGSIDHPPRTVEDYHTHGISSLAPLYTGIICYKIYLKQRTSWTNMPPNNASADYYNDAYLCALATLRKTAERIFVKISRRMYLCTRKDWLNFGSRLPSDPDPGIFKGFFDTAFFNNLQAHICGKTDRIFTKFYHRCIFGQKSPR